MQIDPMSIVVTGSIAFDYLMSFPGKFTEHFLPEHMSRVSLSFLVDTMDKRRGGCAPNIAYTLALLGERPRLMATAGQDFDDYRRWLEAAGVDTSLVARRRRQVHRVVLLQHRRRQQPDRVVLHRRDGQRRRAVVPRRRRTASWRSSRRTIPARWCSTPRSAATLGIPFIWDPGQQCARMSGQSCATGSTAPTHRDLQRLRVRADAAEDRRSTRTAMLEHTRRAGRHARRERLLDLHDATAAWTCRRCRRTRIVDPTGVGDAFRGGFMKGLARGADARGLRPARRRRRDVRARAPRRPEPRLHLGGVRRPLRGALRRARLADRGREP